MLRWNQRTVKKMKCSSRAKKHLNLYWIFTRATRIKPQSAISTVYMHTAGGKTEGGLMYAS